MIVTVLKLKKFTWCGIEMIGEIKGKVGFFRKGSRKVNLHSIMGSNCHLDSDIWGATGTVIHEYQNAGKGFAFRTGKRHEIVKNI